MPNTAPRPCQGARCTHPRVRPVSQPLHARLLWRWLCVDCTAAWVTYPARPEVVDR
jgi:hypothetical protein